MAVYAERGVDGMTPFWDPEITHRAIEGALDDVGEMRGPSRCIATSRTGWTCSTTCTLSVGETRELEDGRVVAEQRVPRTRKGQWR